MDAAYCEWLQILQFGVQVRLRAISHVTATMASKDGNRSDETALNVRLRAVTPDHASSSATSPRPPSDEFEGWRPTDWEGAETPKDRLFSKFKEQPLVPAGTSIPRPFQSPKDVSLTSTVSFSSPRCLQGARSRWVLFWLPPITFVRAIVPNSTEHFDGVFTFTA